jgi:hypothetical protein
MKKIYFLINAIGCLFILVSCDSDFLEKYPKTEITEKAFFNTVTDLETYTNGFYENIVASYADHGTDNLSVHTGGNQMDQMVTGNVSSANAGGWDDWKTLRSLNFFMVHYGNASGTQADIEHYAGITRFFRAKYYYDKVLSYSDVPWYNYPMEADDETLYKACDPRAFVVDSILADIQYAADHVKPDLKTKTRINKYSALALMARICLTEGTFRKYHDELNLTNDYTRFLEKAVWACEQIMQSREFEITGKGGAAYGALFNSEKLDANKEVILQQASNKDLGVTNNTHTVLNWQWSLSRSLMESFLMKDGTPFTQVDGYDKKTYLEVFENRDPRLAETFAFPGFKESPDLAPVLPGIKFGGYGQIKFFPREAALRGGWNLNNTSLPVYRLGEVLLTYAEAKAELGTLTQNDLDLSVNKLRARVDMPALNMAAANATIDPLLAGYYPNVAGVNKGVILEIRRERRVELSCEGLRSDDLKRWAAGSHFADNNQGIYIPYLGAYDMTGDGQPDLAILANPDEAGPISDLTEAQKNKLVYYYLRAKNGVDEGFYLSEDTKGFVGFTAYQKNPRSFIAPKYYYRPIPKQQLILNPKLKQPFGWE